MGKCTLFSEIPPWDLVLQVLTLLKLPTTFPAVFQRQDISLENSDEIAAMLEPYYKPCKAKQFLTYTDQHRFITILRHILQPYTIYIESKETTRQKKKATIYTIKKDDSIITEPVQIVFD
jgi:hypothetical protein